MPEPFSEQNVLHTWEQEFCKRSVPFLVALGVKRLHADQMGRVDRTAELPHTWALGWRIGKGDHKYKTRVIFDGIDYSGGDEVEGTPIIYDLPDTHRGWSEVYRPKAVPISRDIEKSVELDEESWSSYSVNASFEVTNRTTAKAEASVGEIASASVESETTISAKTEFGMDNGNRKKSTYTHTARDHDALQHVHEAGAGEQPRRGTPRRSPARSRPRRRSRSAPTSSRGGVARRPRGRSRSSGGSGPRNTTGSGSRPSPAS